MTVDTLVHNRIELALHRLRDGTGTALLLLHGLGEQSPTAPPDFADRWLGPVAALDFTGHGASTMPIGGGYTAEILMADAALAVEHLGGATVVGRGLGAYIALLAAGALPELVRGAVLTDGPGLTGGPDVPTGQAVIALTAPTENPDPYALVELGRDLRPPDYAATFARLAVEGSPLDEPIAVTNRFRPAWLRAVLDQPGVAERHTIAEALDEYAEDPARRASPER